MRGSQSWPATPQVFSNTRSQFRKHTFSINGSPNPRWRMAPTKFCRPAAVPIPVGILVPSKSEPESDAILAKMFEHVCEMLYDELNGRIGVSSPVGTQEAGGKIDADQATGLTNCRQLLVGGDFRECGLRACALE